MTGRRLWCRRPRHPGCSPPGSGRLRALVASDQGSQSHEKATDGESATARAMVRRPGSTSSSRRWEPGVSGASGLAYLRDRTPALFNRRHRVSSLLTAESGRSDRLPAVTMMNSEEDSHGAGLSWAHHRLRPTAHHRDDLVVPVVPGAGRHSSTRTIPGSARSVPSKNRATCSRVR
jgi:hypothetical protein